MKPMEQLINGVLMWINQLKKKVQTHHKNQKDQNHKMNEKNKNKYT